MTLRRPHPLEAPLRAAIEHYVRFARRESRRDAPFSSQEAAALFGHGTFAPPLTLSARLAADLVGGTATPQLLGRAAPAVVRALTAEGWRITYDDHKGYKVFVITRVP